MIRVDTTDLARIVPALVAMDTEPLTSELAALSLRQTQQRFERREAPDGTSWPPRKDSLPHPLLEKTRRLRRSIQVREPQAAETAIGTAGVPYAATHQRGRGTIPARTYLGWGEADMGELHRTAEGWLQRYVGRVLT